MRTVTLYIAPVVVAVFNALCIGLSTTDACHHCPTQLPMQLPLTHCDAVRLIGAYNIHRGSYFYPSLICQKHSIQGNMQENPNSANPLSFTGIHWNLRLANLLRAKPLMPVCHKLAPLTAVLTTPLVTHTHNLIPAVE